MGVALQGKGKDILVNRLLLKVEALKALLKLMKDDIMVSAWWLDAFVSWHRIKMTNLHGKGTEFHQWPVRSGNVTFPSFVRVIALRTFTIVMRLAFSFFFFNFFSFYLCSLFITSLLCVMVCKIIFILHKDLKVQSFL